MLPSDRSLTQWIAAFCGDAARVALKGGDRCAVEAMAPVGAGRNRVILKRTRSVNDAGETVPYP
jgi:hypothetical protein